MNEKDINFLVGNVNNYKSVNALKPFDDIIIDFLDDLSKELFNNKKSKIYSDIITFAFYIRKSNIIKIKQKYLIKNDIYKYGRGIVFHIAPSNVPVNFAYSLVSSLICGNINYIKVSSKDFEQVDIICESINKIINKYNKLIPFINIFKYNNDKNINDYFSSICDIRVIWGGNQTINILRESPLKPRAREITFADRYSLILIDSNYFDNLSEDDKIQIANSFYNDTYFSDQNACTSPRMICFLDYISLDFYKYIYKVIKEKYNLQEIISSNKLLEVSKFAIKYSHLNPVFKRYNDENYLYLINVNNIDESLIEFKGNSGLFIEYVFKSFDEMESIFDNDEVQTISYIGDADFINYFKLNNFKGIDRVVPVGKTMDFDIIWDGYDLFEMFTKNISINE